MNDLLPDCGSCLYGYSGRCGGFFTSSLQAQSSQLLGQHGGVGCKGDAGPIIRFLRGQRHPDGPTHCIPRLPVFIPQVSTGGLRSVPQYPVELKTFAISLTTLFTKHGKIRWTDGHELRSALKLPVDSRVVLVGSGDDRTLEKIWNRMLADEVWETIARLGFLASTGFSFSVWDVQSRKDQIINQERNLLTCEYLLGHGVPAIPVAFWYDAWDYRAFVKWSLERGVGVVAVITQFIKNYMRFERLCEEMKWLEHDLQKRVHFVVVGARRRQIPRLVDQFSCSVITANPFLVAVRGGNRIGRDLRRDRLPAVGVSLEELAALNVGNCWDFCTELVRGRSGTAVQLGLLNPLADVCPTTRA